MKEVKMCIAEGLKASLVDAIGHQANCFNTMRSGVAATIRKEFPAAIQADAATIKGSRMKLGKFSVGETIYGPVFNLYGQYNYGYDGKQYTDYESLRKAMELMRDECQKRGALRVGFPKIGAGLAGGNWVMIDSIIREVFEPKFDVTIFVKD